MNYGLIIIVAIMCYNGFVVPITTWRAIRNNPVIKELEERHKENVKPFGDFVK